MIDVMSDTASIVVLGSFNPTIFQPFWLRQHKIIGELEAEAAAEANEVEFIHREVTVLNLRDMKLFVDKHRFSLTVLEPPFERGFDFAVAVFSLLAHTPVTALGINRERLFKYNSLEAWHELGDALAPKDIWSPLLGSPAQEPRKGGLRSLTMERGPRSDELPGYTRIEVAPLLAPRETKLSSNDHYELKVEGKTVPASIMVKYINDRWEIAMDEATQMFDYLVSIPFREGSQNSV